MSEPIILRALPAELDWETLGYGAAVTHVWCTGCGEKLPSAEFEAHWDAQHPNGADRPIKVVNPSSTRTFWVEEQR